MKKLNRFGVLIGLLAGAGVLTHAPSAFAQDTDSSMDNVNISLQGPPSIPPLPNMAPGGAMQGTAQMISEPDALMAMEPGGGMVLHGDARMTDDQLEKMYRVKTEFLDRAGSKLVELKEHERALHELIAQPDFDSGKAHAIQNKINALRDDIDNLKLDERIGLVNCLTAEQRKELRRHFVRRMVFGEGIAGGPEMHGGAGMMHHHGAEGCEHRGGHEGRHEHEHHEHNEHHDGGPPVDGTNKG